MTIPGFIGGAREAGKDPDAMERAILVWYSVDPDYEKAVNGMRFWAGVLVPAMFRYAVVSPREIEMHANLVSREAIEKAFLVATDAEGVIQEMERYIDAGINHFCLGNSSPDVQHGIEIFRDIIPHFR